MSTDVHFHFRVPSRDVAMVDLRMRSALSGVCSVTMLDRLGMEERRFWVDARMDATPVGVGPLRHVPRVEVVVRRGVGPTVEVLVLVGRPARRSDPRVTAHAEAVCGVIMRCVEDLHPHSAGIDGHWLAPCGWYLHLEIGSFYFERSHWDTGCSCGACWQESCEGEFVVDGSCLVLRYERRHVWWKAAFLEVAPGVHETDCRGGFLSASNPPAAIERLRVEVLDNLGNALVVESASKAASFFRRINRSYQR